MTNKEVIETIKGINKLADELVGLSEDSEDYGEVVAILSLFLDSITINCPRWKYHKAWTLNYSKRTGHYWVTFNQY